MTFANSLDPDEAPQNVGPHLRSKLFDTQIIYLATFWMETMIFLHILKKKNLVDKQILEMQIVKCLKLTT